MFLGKRFSIAAAAAVLATGTFGIEQASAKPTPKTANEMRCVEATNALRGTTSSNVNWITISNFTHFGGQISFDVNANSAKLSAAQSGGRPHISVYTKGISGAGKIYYSRAKLPNYPKTVKYVENDGYCKLYYRNPSGTAQLLRTVTLDDMALGN